MRAISWPYSVRPFFEIIFIRSMLDNSAAAKAAGRVGTRVGSKLRKNVASKVARKGTKEGVKQSYDQRQRNRERNSRQRIKASRVSTCLLLLTLLLIAVS